MTDNKKQRVKEFLECLGNGRSIYEIERDEQREENISKSSYTTEQWEKEGKPVNKIIQDDCLKGMKKLPDNSIDLVVTSPPYNIGINYGENYDDNQEFEDYKKFIKDVFRELYRVIKDKGLVAVNVGNQRNSGIPFHYYFWLKEAGFNIIKSLVWFKGLYYIPAEFIFVCNKEDPKDYHKFYKKNDVFFSNGQFPSVWKMRYPRGESRAKLGHNAFFVSQLPRNFININTKEEMIVLDPFMGVGTTAVSAKQLNRKYLGFETNPDYIKKAEERLAQQENPQEKKPQEGTWDNMEVGGEKLVYTHT